FRVSGEGLRGRARCGPGPGGDGAERIVPGGAVGDGAGMRPAVRDPARRARDRRAARPAVRGESHEPVLLLQVGAVVEADGAGGGTWLCGGGGRLERG